MFKRQIFGFFCAATLATGLVAAELEPQMEMSPEQITRQLELKLPGIVVDKVLPSPVTGLYEVQASGELLYVSQDGRFLFNGAVFDISSQIANLTQMRKEEIANELAPVRKADISKIPESDMVIFKSPSETHTVTVFTDVDCGYCRKLHSQIDDYLAAGITVRYLAFPRAGLESASAKKLASIWCAKDRQTAMTDAKVKGKFDLSRQCDAPIEEHFALVRKFHLQGTPAIILEEGELVAGYLPPDMLKMRLDAATVN